MGLQVEEKGQRRKNAALVSPSLSVAETPRHFQFDILSQIYDAVIAVDNESRVTFWNKAAEKLYGVKAEEALGKRWTELYQRRWLKPQDEGAARRALAARGFWRGESIHVKRNGDEIYTESTVSVIKDKSDAKVGLLAVIRDISEFRRVGIAFKEGERKYRTLVDNLQEGVGIIDAHARFSFVNPRMAEMLGYTVDEILGRHLFDFLYESSVLTGESDLRQCQEEIRGRHQLELVCKDGACLSALVNITPLREGKTYTGSLICMTDVTEMVTAERAALESQRHVKALFDSRIIGIIVADLDGNILDANDAFLQMVGYTREDLLSRRIDWRKMTPEEYRHLDENALDKLFTRGYYAPFEKEYFRKDGFRVPILIGATLWETEGSTPAWVCFILDISRRRKAGEEREEVLANLEKEKLKAEETAHVLAKEIDIAQVIMENTDAMLAYLDPEFNFVRVNSAYARGSGYEIGELIGHNHFALFPNEENEAIFRRVRDTGEPAAFYDKPFTFPGQPERGVTYWDWTLTLVKDAQGTVRGLVLSLVETTRRKVSEQALERDRQELEDDVARRTAALRREVAERRKAQEELKAKEATLRLILEQTPVMVWTTDRELRINSISGAPLADLNMKPENALGKTVYELYGTDDPDFPPIAAYHRAVAGLSTSFDQRVVGRVLDMHLEPFTDAAGRIQGVLGAGMDITEHKRLEEEAKSISRRLIETQENERRAIARELHDQVSQSLALLKLLLDKAMRSPEDKAKFDLGQMHSQVVELIAQVRNLSLDLRPKVLDDLGLLAALYWHFDRYTAQTQVKINFKHAGLRKQRLIPEINTAIYRIVQESLNNVARHARVQEVTVHLWAKADTIWVRVKDEGMGFDPARVDNRFSTGLSAMRERALLLGGELTIESAPGAGTCVTAQLPMQSA